MGEGGAHRHKLVNPNETDTDGMHKHLFMVNDRLLMTDLSGNHTHPVNRAENKTGPETQPHEHSIQVNTTEGVQAFPTENVTPHEHEIQTSATTLSGLHTHEVELGGNTFLSLLPGDLLDEIEAATKQVPALKDFNLRRSEGPMEMDFQLVKRLNKSDFTDILKTATAKATLKSLSRLADGFQIESLILSRDRFSDIGVARRFVMDNGLDPQASLEGTDHSAPFLFQIRSRERFSEATLHRIQITDGVTAVVGLLAAEEQDAIPEAEPEVTEGTGADSLTENAVEPEPKPAVTEGGAALGDNLKDKFDKVRSIYKSAKTKKFIFLKTNKELKGSVAQQLTEIAEANGIDSKYVTVEYPEKRFVEFLTSEKYEVISASYKDSGQGAIDDEAEGQEYTSLHVKGDGLEAFIVTPEGIGSYRKSLIIFFDDHEKLDKIFKTEIKNYPFGSYQFKMTMMGPILIPVVNDDYVQPILDKKILTNLKRDTTVFFSKKSEDFFSGKNRIKRKMPYKRGVLMYGPPGNGKCLARGTLVLMFDGSIKKVEDITVGEKIMGDDSKPRNILSTTSGREKMYRVIPVKGSPYVVNESHILSLKMNADAGGYRKDEIVDISISNYLQQSNNFKHHAKGFRTGVEFLTKEILMHPYFLGLWLGDGHSDGPRVTTPDEEIACFLEEYSRDLGLRFVHVANCGEANTFGISTKKGRGYNNKLLDLLRQYNLINNKHIPQEYKSNNRDIRLQVLAGLIDSDGSNNNNCCDYITKRETLADDILFLARSLGFAAYKKICKKGYTRTDGSKFSNNYYRISISGDLSVIPTRVEHKKFEPRLQKKDVLVTGVFLEELDEDQYFGFEIDGNRRFLLGDFTVTHNTTFIKNYLASFDDSYGVLCEPQDFDGGIGKFLKQCFGKEAKKVIVFEDVDCIHYEQRSELLNLLDGVNSTHKTLYLATTNYPERLDAALTKRPSRFDQKYYIGLPDLKMRTKFLKEFFPDETNSSLHQAAQKTEGFSGAMFKEVFILTGLQDIGMDQAVEKMKEQMGIQKSTVDAEVFKEVYLKRYSPKKPGPQGQTTGAAPVELDKPVADDEKEQPMDMDALRAEFDKFKEKNFEKTKKKKGKKKLGKKWQTTFKIFKRVEEKKLVTGPILIPETFDLQNDIVSPDEIETAIHNYMIKLAFREDIKFLEALGLSQKSERGFMHTEFTRKIAFVEMYLAPVDFTLNGRKIKQGTAIGTAKVFDAEVWALVKAEKINGFSIGGRSQVSPA